LILMLVGIVIGPLLGIVTPADFGKIGSLIATIALVLILFEGGTTLNLDVLGKSLGTTGLLALVSFVLTTAIIATIGFYTLRLELLPAILLGVSLGNTSSSVVIPMVNSLRMENKPATVLVLESALTDVLSIVGVFALLQIHTEGGFEPGRLIGGVLASLFFAAVIGVLGGIGWLSVLGKVRGFPNTISSTLAYVFIVYGLTEILHFSGAIAALALGISLTNFQKFKLYRIPNVDKNIVALNETDLAFYREAVFLLKTYFFVYLGISIHFSEALLAVTATSMVLMVYALRLVLTRLIFRDESYSLRDTAITSMMAPKGLASAVLATLPLEYGVAGGEVIRDTTYMVVLFSITLTALLVIIYHNGFVERLYARTLNKPLPASGAAES
jgi:cell volume regulation protein A